GYFPIIPRSAEAVFKAQRVFGDAYQDLGLPPFNAALSTPLAWAMFAYQMVFPLPEDNEIVHRSLLRLIEIGAENGFGDYRTTPFHQDHVASSYGFNDNALRRFLETIKDAVDPNGILSPGRGGVWPSVYSNFRDDGRNKDYPSPCVRRHCGKPTVTVASPRRTAWPARSPPLPASPRLSCSCLSRPRTARVTRLASKEGRRS